ncbi:MdtA/MuxA family multidrug efflux RND transporter periplasmic adaptor subunit [Celerinatantimonas sp. YJH-8]|uniref:MdtA/MuxA family multidrug efflux RND transporter periplasmic adaptor subunit n=1 Tax=Celerinatantimonas sp. YJH-8 TaxID=3228714 RepID=UPI0038CA6B3C
MIMRSSFRRCSGNSVVWILVIAIVMVVILGFGWRYFMTTDKSPATAVASGRGTPPATTGHRRFGGPFGGMTSSVYVGKASLADVDVYLHALGTVQANKTVTVTSRVTGELQQVFFDEGQYVKKGQRLAQIDDRSYQASLAQYQGDLQQNQALLKNARQTLARYQKLFQQDSLSQQDLQDQQASVGQYEGTVLADKAQIRAARLNIDYANIRAPISGYVGLRTIDPGNLVSSDSTEIVTITQTQPIAVTFSIPQARLQSLLQGVRRGQSYTVDAYDQNGVQKIASGQLKYISNQIDTDTGTVKLKALFDNQDSKLYPNQFVNAQLQLQTLKQAVVIPQAALQLNSEGDFVFVVDSESKVHKRLVVRGPNNGDDRVVILKGVQAGERVVTTGVDDLSEGAKVNVLTLKKAAQ